MQATIEYLAETRNNFLIPAAVRCASLYLIAARHTADSGSLAIFPKEIVKMIAMEVYGTRKDLKWINAVSGPEYIARQREVVEMRASKCKSNLSSDSESDSADSK